MSSCNGPDSSKWSDQLGQCIASAQQTSCDSVAQDTCFYCYLIDSGDKSSWFSGKFTGNGLKIVEPDLLGNLGIAAGDIVNKVNGTVLTSESALLAALAPYTETAPASVYSATHLLGTWQVNLDH